MEKRIQSIDSVIVVSIIIPIGSVTREKFECDDLENRISNVCKDLNVDWAIEVETDVAAVSVSRTFGPVIGDGDIHKLEIDATNFMGAIEKMQIPEKKKPLPARDHTCEKNYEFIKMLVGTWEETEERAPTTGFAVLAGVDVFGHKVEMPCAHISEALAKELCMSYLKVHSNG